MTGWPWAQEGPPQIRSQPGRKMAGVLTWLFNRSSPRETPNTAGRKRSNAWLGNERENNQAAASDPEGGFVPRTGTALGAAAVVSIRPIYATQQ